MLSEATKEEKMVEAPSLALFLPQIPSTEQSSSTENRDAGHSMPPALNEGALLS